MVRRAGSDAEIELLKRDWDWTRVYRSWIERFSALSPPVDPLFRQIRVFDPAHPTGRSPSFAWWPAAELRDLHLRFQRHLDRHPGTVGPVDRPAYYHRKGERQTLDYLLEAKDSLELVCAVLISASVFARVGSSRRGVPRDNWPSWHVTSHLAQVAKELLDASGVECGWHYSCTDVLPYSSSDWEHSIDGMTELIGYLAEEHATLLNQFVPVELVFFATADPLVSKALREEYSQKAREDAERDARYQQQRSDSETAEKAKAAKHPRYGDWGQVTVQELRRLVWQMSTAQVAMLFGVSDVAVAKRCKALGIPKPPRGFWQKVESGLVPHPHGVPPARR